MLTQKKNKLNMLIKFCIIYTLEHNYINDDDNDNDDGNNK